MLYPGTVQTNKHDKGVHRDDGQESYHAVRS